MTTTLEHPVTDHTSVHTPTTDQWLALLEATRPIRDTRTDSGDHPANPSLTSEDRAVLRAALAPFTIAPYPARHTTLRVLRRAANDWVIVDERNPEHVIDVREFFAPFLYFGAMPMNEAKRIAASLNRLIESLCGELAYLVTPPLPAAPAVPAETSVTTTNEVAATLPLSPTNRVRESRKAANRALAHYLDTTTPGWRNGTEAERHERWATAKRTFTPTVR
jgi:hypothetical protein